MNDVEFLQFQIRELKSVVGRLVAENDDLSTAVRNAHYRNGCLERELEEQEAIIRLLTLR